MLIVIEHPGSIRYSLVLLLLNRLIALLLIVLPLYLLLHLLLGVCSAGAHNLLRDLSILNEVSLKEKFGPFQSVAELSLSILAVENVPELVRKLTIRHQDVLPLSERENNLVRGTTLKDLFGETHEK
jgi:hypothetical protein